MKQMYSPQEFAEKVKTLSDSKVDHVATTDRMLFHSGDSGSVLSLHGVEEKYPVNDVAHAQIANRLGIPKAYYDRMRSEQPALLDANVATWFHSPVERRLVRTLEGRMRAFLSDRYQRIDNIDILAAIAGPFQNLTAEFGAYVESSALTDTKMYVKVVVPGIQAEVQVGDIVQAGFVISNSETGHGSFTLEQMIFTLACRNGMTVGQKLSRRHVGGRIAEGDIFSDRTRKLDDATVLSAARDLIEAAVDETRFNAIVARMRETVNTPASVNPVSTVETLAKTHDLTDEEQGRVLSAFITDAGRNGLGLYGAVNAVTFASQTVEDYERASELEKLGGVLLYSTASEWDALANP